MKSLLFVPADSERKLAKAESCGADALAIDLEDAVLPDRKPLARQMLATYAKGYRGKSQLWVRVNDLASGELLKDLAAVVPLAPVGIVLPKVTGPEDLDIVGYYLDMAEVAAGLPQGQTKLLTVCTETASAVLRMGDLLGTTRPRLIGMLWGGEDLSTALGAGDPRHPDGRWRSMYEHARNQCLLGCHALGIEAIDTVYVDFRNPEGCRASSLEARYDGFTGKAAIHPDQVPVINTAFTPTEDEIAHARRVIAAFSSGAGAVSLDGKMLDIPHLKSARQMLHSAGLEQE
tara:strand:+ start:11723 stop:12589 length:867 start_codon:yes stop_codon:yes gene_type:complete